MGTRAFLAMGSNLGDRRRHLREAVESAPHVVAVSHVYETDPVGGPDQDAYLNLVVELDTTLDARGLLDVCRRLEAAAQRVREVRWGPRTLDVDVLWVDGEVVAEPDLEVPHPRMTDRAFVMVPLGDLAPDLVAGWTDPGTGEVRDVGPLTRTVRVIGGGRAGGAFVSALARVGWRPAPVLGRGDSVTHAADGVDLVLITTPDASVASVAAAIEPGHATVAHAAGSLGLSALAPHTRVAAIHPLISLPTPELGADRLLDHGWFAIAGDPIAAAVVEDLGGRWFEVADENRALYHAAACVASNHLVALLGQVERLAATIGVPAAAYLDLARATVENVVQLGAAATLTGPAARGDDETIAGHVTALPPAERETYESMVEEARRLAGGGAPQHRRDS